jgi:hypothetical protein
MFERATRPQRAVSALALATLAGIGLSSCASGASQPPTAETAYVGVTCPGGSYPGITRVLESPALPGKSTHDIDVWVACRTSTGQWHTALRAMRISKESSIGGTNATDADVLEIDYETDAATASTGQPDILVQKELNIVDVEISNVVALRETVLTR